MSVYTSDGDAVELLMYRCVLGMIYVKLQKPISLLYVHMHAHAHIHKHTCTHILHAAQMHTHTHTHTLSACILYCKLLPVWVGVLLV